MQRSNVGHCAVAMFSSFSVSSSPVITLFMLGVCGSVGTRARSSTSWHWCVLERHLRCPSNGQGRKRKGFDFSRIKRLKAVGRRRERGSNLEPLCREDWIEFWTNHAPRFQRTLADCQTHVSGNMQVSKPQESGLGFIFCPGLSAESADAKWRAEMRHPNSDKEQMAPPMRRVILQASWLGGPPDCPASGRSRSRSESR